MAASELREYAKSTTWHVVAECRSALPDDVREVGARAVGRMSESKLALAPTMTNKRSRRSTSWLGPAAVVLALAVALTIVAIFAAKVIGSFDSTVVTFWNGFSRGDHSSQ